MAHVKRYRPHAPWGAHTKMQESDQGQYVEYEAYLELYERTLRAEERLANSIEPRHCRHTGNVPTAISATVKAEQ